MPPVISVSRPLLHPLHAILLAFPVALFTSALATDITYLNTAEMQWSNFSSWLIAGAEVFGGFVILWAFIDAIRFRRLRARGRVVGYLVVLVVMWVLGLINAFQHSHDAWASVGTAGLLLSIASTVLALIAAWIAHSTTVGQEVAR